MIDFFTPRCSTLNVTAPRFGICDDVDNNVKTPAYIDFGNEEFWIASVENAQCQALRFIAVDNCIEIRRDNGEIASRCDAMLLNDRNLIFIELKARANGAEAVKEAKGQLSATVRSFIQNNDISVYPHRYAYICNKRHPRFAYSRKSEMQQFYNDCGVRLQISADVVIR